MSGFDLQVVVAESYVGGVLHSLARPGGTWSRFGDVGRAVTGEVVHAANVACAAVGNDLHLCLRLEAEDLLRHTIRHPDGSWVPRFGDVFHETGRPVPEALASFACAGVGAELHVLATFHILAPTQIFHAVRRRDGSWQPFAPVLDVRTTTLVACTMADDVLTVCAPLWDETDDTKAHVAVFTVRDGKASAPVRVNVDAPFNIVGGVACANVNGELHVIVRGVVFDQPHGGGRPVFRHTLRHRNGVTWQPWGDLGAVVGDFSGEEDMIAAAAIGNDLETFYFARNDITLWHAIRRPDGSWAKDEVTAHAGALPEAPLDLAAAAVPEPPLVVVSPPPARAFEAVRVHNGTLDDALVVWTYDLSTGTPTNVGTIARLGTVTAALPHAGDFELFVVSEKAVAKFNAAFGKQLDAHDFAVAKMSNFELGRSVFRGGGSTTFDWKVGVASQ